MSKLTYDPGICGFTGTVTVTTNDDDELEIYVETECPAVNGMFEALGHEFDPFELCMKKPGEGPLYEWARENFPGHSGCSAIPAILKAVEVEANMALSKDCSIVFIEPRRD